MNIKKIMKEEKEMIYEGIFKGWVPRTKKEIVQIKKAQREMNKQAWKFVGYFLLGMIIFLFAMGLLIALLD